MGNHQGCVAESERIREIIADILNPSEYSIIAIPDSFAFRIRFGNHHIGLSVSCPADINSRSDENGFRYETAVCDFTAQTLLYIEEWDYDDVRHFSDTDELIEEFDRVRTLALAFQEPVMPGVIQDSRVPPYSSDSDSDSDIPPEYNPDTPPDYDSIINLASASI